jgi:hypothetical protein
MRSLVGAFCPVCLRDRDLFDNPLLPLLGALFPDEASPEVVLPEVFAVDFPEVFEADSEEGFLLVAGLL